LTSIYEGSPNVIKEAMACNCPVVSTDVGDARSLLDNIEGSYISPDNSTDLANIIRKVLKQEGHSDGRKRIFELGLDSDTIFEVLIKVYESKKLYHK
jgi:glycosyltransferase involved in cell wall biosynthesis